MDHHGFRDMLFLGTCYVSVRQPVSLSDRAVSLSVRQPDSPSACQPGSPGCQSVGPSACQPGIPGYAAAKGGVIGFTKTIAAETAADGIRCNTIHPGLIDTNMQRQSSVDNPEEYVKLNAAVPMGYMGPPHTIADAALFLVSDLSTYMTGAQMVIDGGLINQ